MGTGPPPGNKLGKISVGGLIAIIDKKKAADEDKAKELQEQKDLKEKRKEKKKKEWNPAAAEMETIATERRKQKFLQMRSQSSSNRFKALSKLQARTGTKLSLKTTDEEDNSRETRRRSKTPRRGHNHDDHNGQQTCCSKRCSAEERALRQKVRFC